MPPAPTVLVADDSATVRAVVSVELEAAGYQVVEAVDGLQAVELCRTKDVDVVLLDVEMPGLDGWGTVERLKQDALTADVPVVFLTGRSAAEDVVHALELGAHDFVVKPPRPAELRARVASALRVKELQDALRERAAELERIGRTDDLTGLHNRRYGDEQLRAALSWARRHDEPMAVLLVDVDRFKQVNDRLGHQGGDAVLSAVAERLRANARAEDVVARWGGEEFLVVSRLADLTHATLLAERIRSAVADRPVTVHGAQLTVTASVGGTAGVVDAGTTAEALLAAADRNLYRAKDEGRDRVVVSAVPAPDRAV